MEHLRPVPVIPKKKPRPKVNKKMLMLVFLFFIIIFVLLFFHSSLNKITAVQIDGHLFLTEEQLRTEAGVQLDDPYFQTSTEEIRDRLMLAFKEIETVEVTKQFPGKLNIVVHEYPHVAYELNDGMLEVVLANGMNTAAANAIPDKPLLTGWEPHLELKEKLTDVLASIPNEWLTDISEIIPAPSNSYEDRIILYSRSSFEVVTTISKLYEKLSYFDDIVAELAEREITTGRIVMLEADNHEPFETDKEMNSADSIE